MRTLRGALAALLVGALAAGALLLSGALLVRCTVSSSSAIEVEYDYNLADRITELTGSRPLKELVPGDWTSVHILDGPWWDTKISEELGRPVEVENNTYTNLQEGDILVLQHKNEIVRIIRLGQLAAIPDGEYRADVVLRVEPDHTIKMVNPDGSPAK